MVNIGNGYYNNIGVFIVLIFGVYVFFWLIWLKGGFVYFVELVVNNEIYGKVYLDFIYFDGYVFVGSIVCL